MKELVQGEEGGGAGEPEGYRQCGTSYFGTYRRSLLKLDIHHKVNI